LELEKPSCALFYQFQFRLKQPSLFSKETEALGRCFQEPVERLAERTQSDGCARRKLSPLVSHGTPWHSSDFFTTILTHHLYLQIAPYFPKNIFRFFGNALVIPQLSDPGLIDQDGIPSLDAEFPDIAAAIPAVELSHLCHGPVEGSSGAVAFHAIVY